ncbi:MAG TPA: hypothetical protein VF658_15530 [Pyrinomonadaceae bacterium]|jgi:hypothetical protein
MNVKASNRLLKVCAGAVVLVLLSVLLLWPAENADANAACACCSEPGVWYERTDRIDEYEMTEINRLRFDAVANTYMTDAGEDMLEGVSNPAEEYAFSLTKRQRRWALNFKDKAGRTGTLSFTLPASIVEFAADINDGQQSGGGGPLLYKEWRLSGPVTGTGVFKKGNSPQTKFRLVFQGRGNSCTSAEVFDNWKLQIFGPRASYQFYGKFKEPTPAKQ